MSGVATAAGSVDDGSAEHYSFCGDKEDEEGEVGNDHEDDHVGISQLKTPLTPEAWRSVLAELKRSLRLVRGADRAGEEEQRRPRRRRQTTAACPDTSSAINDGGRPGHRQASPSATRPGSSSPEPPRPRSRSSSRSTDRNGGSVLDPVGGDKVNCDALSCDSGPQRRKFGASPRKSFGGRRFERSELEKVSSDPPGRAGGPHRLCTTGCTPFARPGPGSYPYTTREQ